MSVRLLVTNAEESGEPAEYRFDRERIAIGRASANHLTLADSKRVVSKQHAEIRMEGDEYQLIDLGSKNFTYLNGKRMRSGQPYALQSEDAFKIGHFEIRFIREKPLAPDQDQTVFATDFTNPFDEPMARLADALREIADAYEQETSRRREDALEEAFLAVPDEMRDQAAVARVCALLGSDPSEQHDAQVQSTAASKRERAGVEQASRAEAEPTGRREQLFHLMVQTLARLMGIPFQFRHEFIGQTILQSPDREALYEGDAEALKAYLLDPSLADGTFGERLDSVQKAIDKLVVHQVAMIDGYKAAAQNGARQLLHRMNPADEEHAVKEEGRLYELFPMLRGPIALERLQATYQELEDEDWSVAERRVFRPAFIKAYLARMTDPPEKASD